jgi:hypothetical protein
MRLEIEYETGIKDILDTTNNIECYYPAVRITPELAGTLLALRGQQRDLSGDWAQVFFRKIVSGRWNPRSGEPIKISVNGHLIDGQHRLQAIQMSGRTVVATLVTGAVSGGQNDTKPDKVNDKLKKSGITYSSHKSAVVRKIILLVNSRQPTLQEEDIFDELNKFPLHEEIIRLSLATQHTGKAVFYAPMIVASRNYPEQALEFVRAVLSGANLAEDSPALQVIKLLNSARSSNYPRIVMMSVLEAFGHFIDGNPLKQLKNLSPNARNSDRILGRFFTEEQMSQYSVFLPHKKAA